MLTITGLDLTALMDFIDLTGIPYPALPKFVIVEIDPGQVSGARRRAGRDSAQHPADSEPARAAFVKQDGTDYALRHDAGRQSRRGVLPRPGPSSRNEPGLLGAGPQQDVRRHAAGAQHQLRRQHEHRFAELLLRRHAGDASTLVDHHRAELPASRFRFRSRTSICCKAPLAAHAPTPLKASS